LKELEGKEKLTLEDIERAFSVERLNKDFFKRYREFYERFTTHLLSSEKAAATRTAFGIAVLADAKEQEKADKPVRDFAKKLLGRLVFLHFLQKKRWLGCRAGSTDWTGGEADFIAAFFEKAKAAGEGDRFHSKYLTPLFFQALNTPDRKGDLFPLTGSRLPYLNGGLFEEDAPALRALDFPPLLFEELLGFFAEYHFTIDENDPEDHEVGIDPEMLGHIFENLLEDNKDKGAFYTPKAIVQYMARESLRHYLETHLGPDPEIGIPLLSHSQVVRFERIVKELTNSEEEVTKFKSDCRGFWPDEIPTSSGIATGPGLEAIDESRDNPFLNLAYGYLRGGLISEVMALQIACLVKAEEQGSPEVKTSDVTTLLRATGYKVPNPAALVRSLADRSDPVIEVLGEKTGPRQELQFRLFPAAATDLRQRILAVDSTLAA